MKIKLLLILVVAYGLSFTNAQASEDRDFGLSPKKQAALVKQLQGGVEAIEEGQAPETFASLVIKYNNLEKISRNKELSRATRKKAANLAKEIYSTIRTQFPKELEKSFAPDED